MSLASQVTALAGAIRDKINTIVPRLLPSGGTTGQVLSKSSNSDYETLWITPSVGGGSTEITGPALAGRTTADLGAVSEITIGHGLNFVGSALKANVFPIRVNNATNVLLDTDIGRMIVKNGTTAYTWTLPPDTSLTSYPTLANLQGQCIALVNDATAGNLTVGRGTGVALLNGTSDANLTLGPGQSIVLCHMPTANRWRVL